MFFFLLLTLNNTQHDISDDPKRFDIDPDWLGERLKLVEEEKSKIDRIFDFLARYVRKVHSDDFIRKGLKGNPGNSFLDFIGPNNIAYVIALVKNSQDMWDQDIRLHQLGADFQEQWERVICPTIQTKYISIRCNIIARFARATRVSYND